MGGGQPGGHFRHMLQDRASPPTLQGLRLGQDHRVGVAQGGSQGGQGASLGAPATAGQGREWGLAGCGALGGLGGLGSVCFSSVPTTLDRRSVTSCHLGSRSAAPPPNFNASASAPEKETIQWIRERADTRLTVRKGCPRRHKPEGKRTNFCSARGRISHTVNRPFAEAEQVFRV